MNVSYTYDSDGLRTKKTVGSTESEYYYSGGQLVYEKRGTEEFYYSYNAEGQLAVIQYVTGRNTYTYYPALNIRGDVEALYNESGSMVVQYLYDSWGKIISVSDTSDRSIGTKNPFRYRGYYYDEESGLYYLRSRYYDPEVGRFNSADNAIGQIGNVRSYNMYAYCFNNPVNMSDPYGNFPSLSQIFTDVAKIAAVATIVAFASTGAAAVSASVSATNSKRAEKSHMVYKLIDDDEQVQYVGRTTDVDARKIAHGINPKKKDLLNTYMEAGRSVARYLENQVSNEILYWTGN